MLLCAIASTFPKVIVATAMAARTAAQKPSIDGKAIIIARTKTAKPAALEAVET